MTAYEIQKNIDKLEKQLTSNIIGYISFDYYPSADAIKITIANQYLWSIKFANATDYFTKIGVTWLANKITEDYTAFLMTRFFKNAEKR